MPSDFDPAAALDSATSAHKLACDAYWKRKDLPTAVATIEAAIDQGRAAAEKTKSLNPDLANKILGIIKAMSFDLASFTWDGWNEPGMIITKEFRETGRRAAQMNYELALELNLPADKVALAQWMIGAHALSANDFSTAIGAFAAYRGLTQAPEHLLCAEGYLALSKILGNRSISESESAFIRAVTQLKEMNTEDSKFFADQLVSVRKFFETRQK